MFGAINDGLIYLLLCMAVVLTSADVGDQCTGIGACRTQSFMLHFRCAC